MQHPIRHRIKAHRRVRAGDLVPHEWNFRLHPDGQKAALEALYREVGFARSLLLAYELDDGRLKLIDGHLRRDIDPDMEVDVEVLDVTEDEARTLLLSIDPLAGLAEVQAELHARLAEITPAGDPELEALWRRTAEVALAEPPAKGGGNVPLKEQYLVLVECRDERQQVELLNRFQGEGLACRALLS